MILDAPDLFDICARKHRGNPESRAANRMTNKSRDTARIMEYLATVTDATCEEAEDALKMHRSTCSARFSELKRSGRIRPTSRRYTRTGSPAQAWAKA